MRRAALLDDADEVSVGAARLAVGLCVRPRPPVLSRHADEQVTEPIALVLPRVCARPYTTHTHTAECMLSACMLTAIRTQDSPHCLHALLHSLHLVMTCVYYFINL